MMALMLAVAVLSAGALVVYLSGAFRRSSGPPHNIVPVLDGWWGRGKKPEEEEDAAIKEFTIEVSDEELDDLNDRLRKTRWFESVEGTKFHFGIKPEYMKSIQEYWLNEYDWRKQEKLLNKFPQFKTNIEGIDIHFVRATPTQLKPGQKSKPILMVHGWPGSFYEFFKIIPMLIDPSNHGGTDADVFEVICPSLPGYGFSEASHKQGLNVREVGRIFHKLMTRLGFESYYVQGGDWGSMVVDQMAGMFPKGASQKPSNRKLLCSQGPHPGIRYNLGSGSQGITIRGCDFLYQISNNKPQGKLTGQVRGMHSNLLTQTAPLSQMVLGKLVPSLVLDNESYGKFLPSWDRVVFGLKELGYLHLHATKPDTIGHALNDSPLGLAAYIFEKFSSWTNYDWIDLDDGGLDGYWSKDDLLNNVMIYWVSGCITSSLRLYKETIPISSELKKFINTVPAGLADLPHDLSRCQRNWAARHFTNIISYRTYPTGGHFAAFEVPELLVDDIRHFVQKVEELYPEVASES